MSWVRLDDALEGHRKRKRAGHEAFGLWCAALCYSGRYHTDGYVDGEWMEDEAPHKRTRERLVGRLVKVGLLEPLAAGEQKMLRDQHDNDVQVGPFYSEGWLVHDFLDLNPSSVEVAQKREKERLKKADQRRLSRGDTPGDATGDTLGDTPGTSRARASRPRPDPVPVGTETTTPPVVEVLEILETGKFDPLHEGEDMAILTAIQARPTADPLGAARVAAEWSHGEGWRTRSRAQTFRHAMRDGEKTKVKETHAPTAAGMVAKRDTCLDCGTEIKTGVRCRECDHQLYERNTGAAA